MKGELMISDLTINKEEDTGRKYLYAGLFDFYADTEKGLEKLTDTMLENGLFDFSNDGTYVGLDDKKNMHWTYDDGKPSMDWLLKVAGVVKSMNDNGDSLTISISKKFLMDNESVADLTLKKIQDVKNVEQLIDLYVYYLKEVMEGAGYGELLRTQVKGKLTPNIPSVLENGRIYLDN